VFVLLVITFATDTTPSLAFESLDDLFTGHKLFIHINTHRVKAKKVGATIHPPFINKEERSEAPTRKRDRAEKPPGFRGFRGHSLHIHI